jgi:circadian clock protein KaiB
VKGGGRKMGNHRASPSNPADEPDGEFYILRLYVTGRSSNSSKAITNIKRICDLHLPGRCELKIIDLYQQPDLARGKQIIAAPTLVKELPLPLKRIVGDMSDEDRVLIGLDLERVR